VETLISLPCLRDDCNDEEEVNDAAEGTWIAPRGAKRQSYLLLLFGEGGMSLAVAIVVGGGREMLKKVLVEEKWEEEEERESQSRSLPSL